MNCIPMVGRLALAGVASGLRRAIDLAASDVQPGREKTSPNRLGPAYSSSPADDDGTFLQECHARLLLLILVILTIVSLITLLSAPAFP